MNDYYSKKYNFDETESERQSSAQKREDLKVRRERYTAERAKRRQRAVFLRRTAIIAVCAVIVLSVVSLVWFITAQIIRGSEFRYSRGVKISGMDIGDKTHDEALVFLKENAEKAVRDFSLKVNAGSENSSYGKKDFKYDFDFDEALSQAQAYSEQEQSDNPEPGFDKNASEFKLAYNVNSASLRENVVMLAKKVRKEPVNAKISKFEPFAYERFTYQDGKNGVSLDEKLFTKELRAFLNSDKSEGTIKAETNTLEPDITTEKLRNEIVGLSTFTSVSNNTDDGNTNMRLAMEACNGSIIEPGAVWSFNECTGDTTKEENGYKIATVISNQRLEQGVGGGICQASTTIFNAAMLANMAVMVRYNHYWTASYAYPGEDATVDYPGLDLKLKNTTDYQMFMECKMEGVTLTVNIYGYQDPSYDNIKIATENYDIVEGQQYSTRTTRVLYLNHEIVRSEEICTSTYSLTDDYSVKPADSGTFRMTTDGYVQYEVDETEPEQYDATESTDSYEEYTESADETIGFEETEPEPIYEEETYQQSE